MVVNANVEEMARPAVEDETKNRSEIPTANTVELGNIVSYQAGAVVSRAIVSRKTGTITLFAFDAGQGLSEHTAPFDALVHVLEGKAEIAIKGEPFQLSGGEAILLPANHPHAVRATSRFKMLLVMIRS